MLRLFNLRKIQLIGLRYALHFAVIAAGLVFSASPTFAYNPMFDGWLRVNAPAISNGGIGASLSGESVCAAMNPAGLADANGFSFSINASLRKMPPYIAEKSPPQLIGETRFLLVPIAPGVAFATGGNGDMKLGYDWIGATGVGGLPRERFYADERVEAIGISLSAWTKVGAARRSFVHEFERPAADEEYYARLMKIYKPGRIKSLRSQPSYPADFDPFYANVFWRRMGDGETIGLRQTVFPGVVYSNLRERVDFDYAGGESGRLRLTASGVEISPAAWLTLYFENEKRTGIWRAANGKQSAMPESKQMKRNFRGIKVNLAGIAEVTYGKRGAMKSWGIKLISKPISISYAECKDYLSKIAGRPLGQMKTVHAGSIELQLP